MYFSRHHELVNGYRVSVTQIRTDLHLLLMSFPSSDGTSTGLDHGQRSGFATFDFTLRFDMLISYVSVVTYILEILS
jgi:hypothetical protein